MSDITTSISAAIRQPRVVSFDPRADITTFELARALPVLLAGQMQVGWRSVHVEDLVANLPLDARRHFLIDGERQ